MEKFELPVPTQEKIGRWLTWGIIGACVVLAGNLLLPHVNSFLGLVQTALSSMVGITITAAALALVSYAVMTFAPMVKHGVDVFARRAAWALVNMSPTIHLELALEEVQRDVGSFANFLGRVEEVKAQTEERRDTAKEKAEKAQKSYNAAMTALSKPGVSEVRRIELEAVKMTASRESGMWSDAATKFHASVERLDFQLVQNTRLYHVFKSEAKSMEVDIQVQTQKWEQALAEEGIMNLAEKLLLKKSTRQQYAEMAEHAITARYAGNIGRMRNLKRLAQDSFNKFDLQTGEYDAIAYDKWQQQMTQVIDNRSGQLEQVPMARIESAQPIPRF